MTETTSPMHLEPAGQAPRACDYCGAAFNPKRAWSRFCSSAHRTAFHTSEGRANAIRDAALRMFEALQQIARGADSPVALATAAIYDLKTPEPIPALAAQLKALDDTIEQVNKDADRRDGVAA